MAGTAIRPRPVHQGGGSMQNLPRAVALSSACVLLLGTAACGSVEIEDLSHPAELTESEFWVQVGTRETWFKINKDQSSGLDTASEKCALAAGVRIPLTEAPRLDGEHLLVTLNGTLPDCEFTKGYVYKPHIAASSGIISNGLTRGQNAFLSMIAYAEGTNDSYDYSFGYHRFYSYADHPRKRYCSGSLCSDAAGRYQFLSRTWDSVVQAALRLPDFGPRSQDRGALFLIENRGVRGVENVLSYQQFTSAIYKCAYEWASLPGSPYGQPMRTMTQVWNKYNEKLR